jgi:hypothetical protein
MVAPCILDYHHNAVDRDQRLVGLIMEHGRFSHRVHRVTRVVTASLNYAAMSIPERSDRDNRTKRGSERYLEC